MLLISAIILMIFHVFHLFIVYVCVWMYAMTPMLKWEENLRKLILSFHCVDFRTWTQVSRFNIAWTFPWAIKLVPQISRFYGKVSSQVHIEIKNLKKSEILLHAFFSSFSFSLSFSYKISLYNQDLPPTQDHPASTIWVLELQICSTSPIYKSFLRSKTN